MASELASRPPLSRSYRGARAPGAAFAILLTLAVNAALFGAIGWINRRASTPEQQSKEVTQVQLIKPRPRTMAALPPRTQRPCKPQQHVEPLRVRSQKCEEQHKLEVKPIPCLIPTALEAPECALVSNVELPAIALRPTSTGQSTRGHDVVDQRPNRTKYVRPIYPFAARRLGRTGWVDVQFIVDTNGKVRDAKVAGSHGGRYFCDSAIRSVKQWLFTPGKHQGQNVPVLCEVRIDFKMDK